MAFNLIHNFRRTIMIQILRFSQSDIWMGTTIPIATNFGANIVCFERLDVQYVRE